MSHGLILRLHMHTLFFQLFLLLGCVNGDMYAVNTSAVCYHEQVPFSEAYLLLKLLSN